jgi:hypothetical protein
MLAVRLRDKDSNIKENLICETSKKIYYSEKNMKNSIENAKAILLENKKVKFGIFGIIESSGYFPPRIFLNQFLLEGNDPCDQDGRMDKWIPFELNIEEFEIIKDWWIDLHPNTIVDNLNQNNWDDWIQKILDND